MHEQLSEIGRELNRKIGTDSYEMRCTLYDIEELFKNGFYGLYSPEDDLLSVHYTIFGAKKNKEQFEKTHGEGFYIDKVLIHE